jgi:hypothetical protein
MRPDSSTDPGSARRVAVVLAAVDARDTVAASVARFLEQVGERGEVVLVDASRDGTADVAEQLFPRLHVIRHAPGRLVPELWTAGLVATRAPLVAFSTAQMVPSAGWLAALDDRLEQTGAAAVGGAIEPAGGLSPSDRALYLLRYVRYLRPIAEEVEPPGDNALYRRSALADLESAWERGFWEVEVHRRLRERGEALAMAQEAVVEFVGGSRLGEAVRQRGRHARHYGASRAARMGFAQRLARSAATPIVPAVLLQRIGTALGRRGQSLRPWLPALPPLAVLLAAWSCGEAAGTWLGPDAKHQAAA